MKKLLPIMFLFFSLNFYAQESWKPNREVQKTTFDKALNALEKSEYKETMRHFYYAYKMGIDTELGKLALAKFDSILTIEKTKLLKGIQGTWILNEVGSNWGFEKINSDSEEKQLVINQDLISFYENGKLIKKEEIKFTEATYFGVPSYTTFDYSDRQIWNYELKDRKHNKNENVLHLKNEGYFRENGVRTEISCGNTEMYYERIK
ncbi:hypothetical protein [Lacinutrix himadriensis]|uniref:hypothetical protein n=1 Tax=Lacinutrix himadriensis TaxID=641549 RepID=UPI00128F3695|nr:hypothetical protein [Lacinutrix himadriensis]